MCSTWAYCNRPPSLLARFWTSRRSMSWPTKAISKARTSRLARKAGLTPHVPKPQRGAAVANGFFRKDEFRYDAAQDAYVCPGRHELKPIRQGRLRDMRKVDYANARACRDCPLRPRCTNNYRAVSCLENEDALDRMAARLGQR